MAASLLRRSSGVSGLSLRGAYSAPMPSLTLIGTEKNKEQTRARVLTPAGRQRQAKECCRATWERRG